MCDLSDAAFLYKALYHPVGPRSPGVSRKPMTATCKAGSHMNMGAASHNGSSQHCPAYKRQISVEASVTSALQ